MGVWKCHWDRLELFVMFNKMHLFCNNSFNTPKHLKYCKRTWFMVSDYIQDLSTWNWTKLFDVSNIKGNWFFNWCTFSITKSDRLMLVCVFWGSTIGSTSKYFYSLQFSPFIGSKSTHAFLNSLLKTVGFATPAGNNLLKIYSPCSKVYIYRSHIPLFRCIRSKAYWKNYMFPVLLLM